ncbi:MAG: exo-alpha-sialidase, partial [Chloroflexi bacterium]|nr:exo-alpha-sialidase [Chloroflexota bacterium]
RVAERLFALGTVSTDDRGGSRGAVFYTDDGQTWIEANGNFEGTRPSSLAGSGNELLLIGTRNSDIRPLAWRSPDGATWTPVELQLPVNPAQADMGTVASPGDGYLAVGAVTAGSTAAPVVWRSGDGASWSCQLLDAAGFDSARPFELHRAGNAWLALGIAGDAGGFGASSPGYPIAWASQDGLSWSAALGRDEPISDGGIAFGSGAEQFIAIGRGRAWTSLDGIGWTLHEQSDGAPDGTDALAVGPDGRLVAVGTRYDGTEVDPWISVAELGTSDRSASDRRVAPLADPPAFGDGPWGPLAVVEAPSDSGDLAALRGNLRIGERCVTVGSLDHPTPVIWRNSQTHWNVATDTIVFFDPITAQSVELHDGDFVRFGGGGVGPEGGPAPADLPWLNPPDPSCLGEAFGVHSLSQVNDFELRP